MSIVWGINSSQCAAVEEHGVESYSVDDDLHSLLVVGKPKFDGSRHFPSKKAELSSTVNKVAMGHVPWDQVT